jgi:hypothetical protein
MGGADWYWVFVYYWVTGTTALYTIGNASALEAILCDTRDDTDDYRNGTRTVPSLSMTGPGHHRDQSLPHPLLTLSTLISFHADAHAVGVPHFHVLRDIQYRQGCTQIGSVDDMFSVMGDAHPTILYPFTSHAGEHAFASLWVMEKAPMGGSGGGDRSTTTGRGGGAPVGRSLVAYGPPIPKIRPVVQIHGDGTSTCVMWFLPPICTWKSVLLIRYLCMGTHHLMRDRDALTGRINSVCLICCVDDTTTTTPSLVAQTMCLVSLLSWLTLRGSESHMWWWGYV